MQGRQKLLLGGAENTVSTGPVSNLCLPPPPLSIAYYLFGMMPLWCLARKINKKAPTLVPILLSSAQISVEI